MHEDQADPSPSVATKFHQTNRDGRFQLSNKLRQRLEKLEEWRIESSLIEFSDDPHEFHGGNAAVEQAFIWVPLSDDKDSEDGLGHTSHEPTSPDGLDVKTDGHAEESECDGRDTDGPQASETRREDYGDKDDSGETEEHDESDHEVVNMSNGRLA
ncbi:hypothetical protein FS837_011788 [Tulasnella sp. UAMH 9824]|nr:hypothetical protein FS837_011788 [Tulasnella sp. UAMH 9824]